MSVPALVLHGRRDRVTPIADSRELARLIPGAELQLMPGGHLAVLRAQAVAYAERIDAFTARTLTASSTSDPALRTRGPNTSPLLGIRFDPQVGVVRTIASATRTSRNPPALNDRRARQAAVQRDSLRRRDAHLECANGFPALRADCGLLVSACSPYGAGPNGAPGIRASQDPQPACEELRREPNAGLTTAGA